jgi:DNA-binding MarR family transcriptional regulator
MPNRTLQDQLKMSKSFRCIEEEVFLNLKVTDYNLTAKFEELFREVKLTEVTYNILRILRGAGPNGLPCAEISKRMLSRVPDVTRLIDRLVALEFVTRERKEGDRRVVIQQLTEKGSEILVELDKKTLLIHQENFASIKPEDLMRLNELLNVVRNNTN